MIIDKRALREELSNPAIGSNAHLRKLALALLDELEPMALAHLNLNLLCDVYRSAYEEARHDELVNWEAAASLTEENGDLKRKLEAAEKRIAELEALEVALPERYEIDVCPTPSPDGEWYSREDVLSVLVSAGVKVAAAAKGE